MCGIVGYVGHKKAVNVVLNSLKRLEYRGYDSSGIAICQGDSLYVEKRSGKISVLESAIDYDLVGNCTIGMGHTRWATHGEPTDVNSHPHTDCTGDIALIHNGIIENYKELKKVLTGKGHVFKSETDTEVIEIGRAHV